MAKKKTEEEKKEALAQIEAKVKAAADLIREAEKLAQANDLPFLTGIVSAKRYNEKTEEYDLPVTNDDEYYDETYTVTEAGWSPSSLNC